MQNYEEMKKSILDMSHGAIKERVDYEMSRILDNILDANTKPDAKRKLVLTLTITPDSERQNLTVETQAKATLCPTNPVKTALYVTGSMETGEMQVVEMTAQLPGQTSFTEEEQEAPAILKVVNFR